MAKRELDKNEVPKSTNYDAAGRDVSRRKFIHGVVAASAIATGFSNLSQVGPRPPALTAPNIFTPQQRQTLRLVLNQLIPQNGMLPGAGDLGVTDFIEQAAVVAPHLRQPIGSLLDEFLEVPNFERLPEAKLDVTIRDLERARPREFDVLVQASYAGYYSQQGVQEALEWSDPADSEYRAVPLDPRLTERVRERGLMFASAMLEQSGKCKDVPQGIAWING